MARQLVAVTLGCLGGCLTVVVLSVVLVFLLLPPGGAQAQAEFVIIPLGAVGAVLGAIVGASVRRRSAPSTSSERRPGDTE